MTRALVLVRAQPQYRREAFEASARAAGYQVVSSLPTPARTDICITWNRYGGADAQARAVEAAGGQVLVTENGYLGRDARGQKLYALHLGMLHGAGRWPRGGAERLAALALPAFEPWRTGGREVLVLAQRGIGIDPVRASPGDAERVAWNIRRATGLPVRIRIHPGDREPEVPLEHDLREALYVVTHTSAAGLHAMMMGVPCVTTAPWWMGLPAAMYVAPDSPRWPRAAHELARDDGHRLATFQRIAWAQWTVDEIATGEPIRRVLSAT